MIKTEIIDNKIEVEFDGKLEVLVFESLAIIRLLSKNSNMDELEFIEFLKDTLIKDRNGDFL